MFLVYKKKKSQLISNFPHKCVNPFLKGKKIFFFFFLFLFIIIIFFWKDSTKSCHLNKRVANELLDVLVNFIIR